MRYAQINEDGFVIATGETAGEVETADYPNMIRLPNDFDLSRGFEYHYDRQANLLLNIGLPPSPFHTYSIASRQWVPDLDRARASRNVEVDDERSRRNFLKIEINGVEIDGDELAQKNLTNKIAEVSERIRLNIQMPSHLMVWRDAANETHVFSDIRPYHDWLSVFAIALAERGTSLYLAAWRHKANIEGLADIDSILAYDVSTGWTVGA